MTLDFFKARGLASKKYTRAGLLCGGVAAAYGCYLLVSFKLRSKQVPITTVRVDKSTKKAKGKVFFIHGWPDSALLFDKQVSALTAAGFDCFGLELPNFTPESYRLNGCHYWGWDFPLIVDSIIAAIRKQLKDDSEVGNERVTIVAHDWGAFVARMLVETEPALFSRICLLEIGDAMPKLSHSQMRALLFYQCFNVLVFALNRHSLAIGNALTLFCARHVVHSSAHKSDPRVVANTTVTNNYMYFYFWLSVFGRKSTFGKSPKDASAVRNRGKDLPTLFVYGKRKPFQFHSRKWEKRMNDATYGNECIALDCGHWLMHESGGRPLNEALLSWLRRTQPVSSTQAPIESHVAVESSKL